MSDFPNTDSLMNDQRTNSGLSTQIIMKVNDVAVGAIQELTVEQSRGLERIKEVGTDGIIEIVPNDATQFTLNVQRVVYDQLRLPEALSRGFRFINAQRIPFDIEVFDIGAIDPAGAAPSDNNGLVVHTYKNCWFNSYNTPYQTTNYVITERATIWCETAFISNLGNSVGIPGPNGPGNLRNIDPQTDSQGIEASVNAGQRRGATDATGLLNSLFD